MKYARILLLLATTAAAVLAATAPARAAAGFEVDIEDERLLLSGSIEGPFAASAWDQLGVKEVRIQAHWWTIAPGEKSTRKPSGFKSYDPNDPKYDWSVLDQAVHNPKITPEFGVGLVELYATLERLMVGLRADERRQK